MQLSRFEQQLGIANVCLVAVSIYGTDNSLILDALAKLDGRARAVVSIDPVNISDDDLTSMHEQGVRGVRLNLKTWGKKVPQQELEAQLFLYADRIRRLGWALQMYLSLDQVALIYDCVPTLGVPIVIDHMASPSPERPAEEQNGYHELLELLERGLVWIKLSGAYRFEELPDLDTYGQALIEANPRQVVWASDWPHTGGTEYNVNGDRFSLQDFRKVDDSGFIQRCFDWCHNREDLIENLFVNNAQRLWTSSDNVQTTFRSRI